MKALNKKILTVCLALAMAVVMALPTFAAGTIGDYYFRAANGTGEVLNVWAPSAYEGAAIRLYTYTGDSTQKWRLYQAPDGSYSLRTIANTALAINKSDSTGRAILWTWSDGREDSDMNYATQDGGNQYRFWLRSASNNYLTAEGISSGDYVSFKAYNIPNSQWKRL